MMTSTATTRNRRRVEERLDRPGQAQAGGRAEGEIAVDAEPEHRLEPALGVARGRRRSRAAGGAAGSSGASSARLKAVSPRTQPIAIRTSAGDPGGERRVVGPGENRRGDAQEDGQCHEVDREVGGAGAQAGAAPGARAAGRRPGRASAAAARGPRGWRAARSSTAAPVCSATDAPELAADRLGELQPDPAGEDRHLPHRADDADDRVAGGLRGALDARR